MDFNRFDDLRASKGVTVSFLCSIVGKNRGYIKDCRTKNTRIPPEYIKKWADALGTTPEYLNGETDEKEKPATVNIGDGLSEKEANVLRVFRTLPPDVQDHALALLKSVARPGSNPGDSEE